MTSSRINASLLAAGLDVEPEQFPVYQLINSALDDLGSAQAPDYSFISCTMPHVPWICPSSLIHRLDDIPMWQDYNDDLSNRPSLWSRTNHHNLCKISHNWPKVAAALSHYYGCIATIDYAVGRLLDGLEQLGILDSTCIVFTADHGELLGHWELIGKGEQMTDHLLRVPMLWHWPDAFPAGSTNDALCTLSDCFSTFAHILGIPDHMPGKQP